MGDNQLYYVHVSNDTFRDADGALYMLEFAVFADSYATANDVANTKVQEFIRACTPNSNPEDAVPLRCWVKETDSPMRRQLWWVTRGQGSIYEGWSLSVQVLEVLWR